MDSGTGERRRKIDVTGGHSAAGSRYIPEEIITNILGRLPIKSRGRFRCVSKQWYSWISYDIRTFKLMIRTDTSVLDFTYDDHEGAGAYISFDSMDQNIEFKNISGCYEQEGYEWYYDEYDWSETKIGEMEGSCNGLILINCRNNFYLWNPSISYCSEKLPHPPKSDDQKDVRVLGLCFDSKNGDYKALMGSYRNPQGHFIMVGSFKSQTWTRVNIPHQIGEIGVVANGRIHWLAYKGYNRPYQIVCFDPNKGEFADVPMPDKYDPCIVSQFCLLDGCLCMVFLVRNDESCEDDGKFEILIMEEYGVKESWAVVFKIEPRVPSRLPEPRVPTWSPKPLFYTYDKEKVLIEARSTILVYDRKGTFCCNLLGCIPHCYGISSSIVYEETFVKPAW